MERNYSKLLSIHFPANSLKTQFLAIFYHLCLWMEDPLIDKNVITRCNCNNIHGGRAAPVYYHPFAIFHYLHLLRGNPSQSPLLLTKIIVLGAVTMISMERELLQAIITSPFAWKWNFLLFLAIFHHLCLLMGDPMTSSIYKNLITGYSYNDI